MYQSLGVPPSIKLGAPYPAWRQQDIQIVELAIVSAWKFIEDEALRIDVTSAHHPANSSEVELSAKLLEYLESILNSESIKGFDGRRFSPPVRGQELANVTGSELEKRPDISIRLQSSRPYSQYNSLIFECKRISAKRLISDYVNEGLIRFCDQRYAWAMPHAGMIAYVQGLCPIPQAKTELEKHWRKNSASKTLPVHTPFVENNGSVSVTITKHKRHNPLPNGKTSDDITIRHLWLST
ncbi:MAG: hypothetical protein WBK51_09700 [Polaromonas sp.]